VNALVSDPSMVRLATIRSDDQANTTIYSYNDRYRGVYKDRMVLFMNAEDRAAPGLEIESASRAGDNHRRRRAVSCGWVDGIGLPPATRRSCWILP
jgi:hypothetical protein